MITLPIGFILIALTIFASVEFDAWPMYINLHAIVIVVFGTFAVLILSTPTSGLKNLFRAILTLTKRDIQLKDLVPQITELSKSRKLSNKSENELMNYAAELWDQGVESELFIVLLSQKRAEMEEKEIDAIQTLRNLAKYPPALGMTGTVIGLVALFNKIGGDQASLGPALALAMTATFFGLGMANGIVQPLADRIHVNHIRSKRLYTNIYHLLLLINSGEASAIVEDEVKYRSAA